MLANWSAVNERPKVGRFIRPAEQYEDEDRDDPGNVFEDGYDLR